ncbi:MAG: HAMP domain-containing protein [Acidobacteria bacterium]|nr:HAMP domain-containing protein [Acidobacteriota bacterium]
MLKKISIGKKLLILSSVFVIPLFFLSYLLFDQLNANIAIANKERMGVEYINTVKPLLTDVEDAMVISSALLNGDASFQSRIASKFSDIDKHLGQLDDVNSRLSTELKTTEKLGAVKNSWRNIKDKNNALKIEENFVLYSQLNIDLLALIAHAADTSTLILDPELDTYYLMDTNTARIPSLFEALGQAKSISLGVITRKALSPDERVKLAVLMDKIAVLRDSLGRNFDVANGKNPVVRSKVGASISDTANSINQFLDVLDKRLVNSQAIDISTSDYLASATKAASSIASLYDSSSSTLDELLALRAKSYSNIVWIAATIGILTLVLGGAFVKLIINNITSPLKQALGLANQLAKGDVSTNFKTDSEDEIGELLTAMNEVVIYLNDMSIAANSIAGGDLNQDIRPKSSKDVFGQAFKNMVKTFQSIASIADSISEGDLSVQVQVQSQSDAFGNAFKTMVDNLRSMAEVADSISKGDLSIKVKARSSQDAFGNAFEHMVENLREVARVADSISKGELNIQISPQSTQDAFGNAFKRMTDNLRNIAKVADSIAEGKLNVYVEPQSENDIFGNTFKKMLDSLCLIIRDLMTGVQSLSSAAEELVSTSSQQSNSINEQASSIQEITTTLDEIRAIVEQSSSRAKEVVQVTEQSLGISKTGQQELEQVVGAMGKIKDQVETIAENILDLSEKTIQIGEITSSVNDIAEQSNLLAVNAAIEATKAGEAGKGFGVVAVEVKNLAARSKKATTQVRSILSEIQKAANSTVLVTEEGSKKVDNGVEQVYRIGNNIKNLHEVIVESSSAARQIASSTSQQVIGIEQIAQAMKYISQGVNEAVVSARQQKETARSLSSLAGNINNIVQRYRLS